MTWRLTRLASRRNYNGIKLFSEPRSVDARVPKGIGTVIATVFYIFMLVRLLHSQRHALAQMSSIVRVARQFKTCSALVGSA
jgi:hypothetical protein